MKLVLAGDSSVFIKTGDEISPDLSKLNRSLIEYLNRVKPKGIRELVASYLGVMVYFDPLTIEYQHIEKILKDISSDDLQTISEDVRGLIVPIAYGGEYGPDIHHVASLNGLTPGEVAAIHSSGDYIVHMLGFTPGFSYLGGMDKKISSPRKAEPAIRVEPGSVGIAGDQTGIYPVESPGGWQIIGRTPLILFDPARKPEALFRAGMRVKFRAIDNNEFWFISEEITSGEYNLDYFLISNQ
jgi:inhibitor of KinA